MVGLDGGHREGASAVWRQVKVGTPTGRKERSKSSGGWNICALYPKREITTTNGESSRDRVDGMFSRDRVDGMELLFVLRSRLGCL